MDSQEPRPLSPAPANQIPDHARNEGESKNKLITRRAVRLALVAGIAGLATWLFWPTIDGFLEGHVVGGLTAVIVAAFTVMVWWSTDKMGQVSVATLRQLEAEYAASHRPSLVLRRITFERITEAHPEERPRIKVEIANVGDSDAII